MMHETLNLLIKDNLIDKKEVFRDTYNNVIHPDVLDYTTPEMFEVLGTEQGNNIFQLSTDMGMKACQMIKPKSVNQMGLVNSLMRLMSDGGETPLEKYQRFSNDIENWYKEMKECGLNQEEIEVLEEYLLPNNGICAEQEDLMSILGIESYNSVVLLTKDAQENYEDYIHKILDAGDDYAFVVKQADMKDHMTLTDTLTEKLRDKYIPVLHYFL